MDVRITCMPRQGHRDSIRIFVVYSEIPAPRQNTRLGNGAVIHSQAAGLRMLSLAVPIC
jgi:hypothetical protein